MSSVPNTPESFRGGSRLPATPTFNGTPDTRTVYNNQGGSTSTPTRVPWANNTDLTLISENDVSVPYVNAMLTVLYHVLPVRNVFLQHLCFDEHCLCCQIGFLYRVLTDKKPYVGSSTPSPIPKQQRDKVHLASSGLVVQSLKTIEEAKAIERIQADRIEARLAKQASRFLQFLIGHVQKELGKADGGPVEDMGSVLKIEHVLNSRCLRCNTDSPVESSDTSSYILKLVYPSQEKKARMSFCRLIEHSLHDMGLPTFATATGTKQCAKCRKSARTSLTKRIRSLPPVLVIDTDITNAMAVAFWTFQLGHSEKRPTEGRDHPYGVYEPSFLYGLACSLGLDCYTTNCRFNHPGFNEVYAEEVSAIAKSIPLNRPIRSTQSLPDLSEWSHYLAPVIYVSNKDGLCTVSETATGDAANTVVYHLMCCVMEISMPSENENESDSDSDDDVPAAATTNEGPSLNLPSYLISEICNGPRINPPIEPHKNWVIVNDEGAMKVGEHTALSLDMSWKRPVTLVYVQSDHPAVKNLTEKRAKVPMEVFWQGENLATADVNSEVSKITHENIPKEGDRIGIDAEFIELKQAGPNPDPNRKAMYIGRVSCIDVEGRVIIDDYIRTDSSAVRDYITKYSGIVEADLNPLTSQKYLTTHKYTYMKILYLIEQKIMFVGHALDNDFGVLKLFAPYEQRRDSAILFHKPNKRIFSLQFLAYHFFGEVIQENQHCSVQDARTAMRLCTMFEELKAKGELNQALDKLYSEGKKMGWRINATPANAAEEKGTENEKPL